MRQASALRQILHGIALLGIASTATPVWALNQGEPASKPAEAALADLKEGNGRFSRSEPRHEGQDEATRKTLTSGQAPEAIILSCSDSRAAPETVFDQGLGRLFTVRVAGNVAEPATIASIEYAVAHLGARLIVVMGHESCGAVKAALETPKGESAGSKNLDTLVGEVRTNLGGRFALKAGDKTLAAPVRANVLAVAAELPRRSKIIRDGVAAGRLRIAPAVYSLETGVVDFDVK